MRDEALESALVRALEDGTSTGVVAAYLFGSQAEGRGHRESDVDVGVLLDRAIHPTVRDRFELRVRLSARFSSALAGRAVDVVILDDAPAGFARHVVTTGRRIACSDERRDRDFVRDVQLRAADLEPFLRRTRRLKLEAMGPNDVPRRTAG